MNNFFTYRVTVRLLALLAPMFTVFYPLVYEHPDLRERKIIQTCLFTGFSVYLTAGLIYFLN